MDLKVLLHEVSELMRKLKEDWVKSDPENPDLAIYLHLWRDGELAVMAQCPLDRDTALQAAQIGAMGFGAEALSCTFESYHTEHENNPLTGKHWEHMEMQQVAQTIPDALEKGWVVECLTTSIHSRLGAYGLQSLAYRYKDGGIEWLTEKSEVIDSEHPEEGKGGGVMFDVLQMAITTPTIEERIAEMPKDSMGAVLSGTITDPEERLFHTDMATIAALKERELVAVVMLTAEPGSNRARWIDERLGPDARAF